MTEPTDRNVFILGAGFSASAGVPLIHNFLDYSRQYLDDPSSGLQDWEREKFREVFEFRRKMSQAREKIKIDLDNIEHLFGLVEIARRLDSVSLETRNATVYLIQKTIELAAGSHKIRGSVAFQAASGFSKSDFPSWLTTQQGVIPAAFIADTYQYFALLIAGLLDGKERFANRHTTVITFNYDLVLDDALKDIGVEPKYWLTEEDVDEKSKPFISLLKLHGSTNWAICGDKNCGDIRVLPGKLTTYPDFRQTLCYKCLKQTYQPLLSPPSWEKGEYRDVTQRIWQRAVNEVQKATRICIIGYSMPQTDAFFQYLLTLALAE